MSARADEIFEQHFEDIHLPDLAGRIGERLRGSGVVTLDGLKARAQVLDLVRMLMTILPQCDSDPDGLTVIRDTGRHAGQVGFAGFGNGEILPHTERSGVARPPRLMLLACARPADTGGECVLVDGQAVHADLAAHNREALDALSARRSAFFGGGDGHLGSVFSEVGNGRVALRFRQDALARFSPEASPHVSTLRAAIERHRGELRLASGEAFLIDNHRWLHARRAFTGLRRLHRALGIPLPAVALPPGFEAKGRKACAA
ncbi:hypothetical protein P3T37_001818 [Kitasatospora sp. MAA4]|uniref:TauD/TfdA family dioxygenase n=1 Tax=Kitasatospora sp. MAA4 TaxID=3035093 RepID=UPI0024746834|nr:TauD/TfdA family dioxygenase [Kitasatospora sp. MAA4]MDH6132433.1 hypothetical protein [Kitasatospora sp. MAA4]